MLSGGAALAGARERAFETFVDALRVAGVDARILAEVFQKGVQAFPKYHPFVHEMPNGNAEGILDLLRGAGA